MADRIRFAVQAIPLETLTDENGGTRDIIASEVGRSLSGSGDSIDLNFSYNTATAATQGYLNTVPNYVDAVHTAGGAALGELEADFIFIKNTGRRFADATTLGATSTDCVMVVFRTLARENGIQNGWSDEAGIGLIHYFEVAWLKPGQAIVLPAAANKYGISQFGSNVGDLTNLSDDSQYGTSKFYVRTFQANGTAATDGNAVEFLAVT